MARPGLAAIVDQSVTSVANFLTGVILARALLPEGFGLYMLGLTVIILALDLQTTVTTTPYMVFAPQMDVADRRRYLGSTVVSQLVLSGSMTIVLAGVSLAAAVAGSMDIATVSVALILSIGLMLFRDFIRRVYFAHLQPIRALVVDSVVATVQITGLLLLVWLDLISVFRAFVVMGVAAGVVSVGWLFASWSKVEIVSARLRRDISMNLSFGRWPLMSGLVWAVAMYAYPWLLVGFHGPASAGVWAAGLGIMAFGNPLVLGLQNYFGPRIASDYAVNGAVGLRRSVAAGIKIFALIVGPFAAILALIGGHAVRLIYGDAYSGNGALVALLMAHLLVSAVAFCLSRGLFALERADLDFKVNVIALAVMATIGAPLAYNFGVLGAAWGLLASSVVATGLRASAFDRQTAPRHA